MQPGRGLCTLLPSKLPFLLLASGLDLLSELLQAPSSNLHPVPIVPTCLSPLESHLEFQTLSSPFHQCLRLGSHQSPLSSAHHRVLPCLPMSLSIPVRAALFVLISTSCPTNPAGASARTPGPGPLLPTLRLGHPPHPFPGLPEYKTQMFQFNQQGLPDVTHSTL